MRVAKPKSTAAPRLFSTETAPTIDNAIAQIKVSKFGQTKAGRYTIDKIERLHKGGKVSIADLPDKDRQTQRAIRTPDGIVINTRMTDHVSRIASQLVHEAAHDLLSDEYARTGRQPNGNSIDQEAITNGYQLRLYREQRKYGFSDRELERRLAESNRGKLRDDIRKRYPKIPESQPKK